MPVRKMRLRLATGLIPSLAAAVALALSVSGCGSSTSAVLDPVAQAADVTSHVGGAHMALSMRMSVPGLSAPFTMNGGGFFNYTTREGALALEMSGLPAGAAASLPSGPLRIEEILNSSAVYIGSPLF